MICSYTTSYLTEGKLEYRYVSIGSVETMYWTSSELCRSTIKIC